MKRAILTTAAVFAAVLMLNAPVLADSYSWTGSNNNNWDDPNNWSGGTADTYPDDSNDSATIPSGSISNEPTVNVSVTVGSVEVQADRTVTMAANLTSGTLTIRRDAKVFTQTNTLEVSSSSGLTIDPVGAGTEPGYLKVNAAGTVSLTGGGTHTINGEMHLQVTDSTLLISTNSATLSGDGVVEGQNNGAQILIADGMELINQTTIQGALTIDEESGSAEFDNRSLVRADRAGRIEVKNVTIRDTVSEDSDHPRWKVSDNASAELRFSIAATSLVGDFDIDTGTLDIDANVTTSGNIDFSGGQIQVCGGMIFQAS